MARRSLEGPGVLLLAMVLASGVAFAAVLAPLVALAGAAGLVVLALVVVDATALLLLLVAAFPWDDALPYPSETVSVIKLLGALLFVGYVLRALSRWESVRLPGTLLPVVLFTMIMLLSLLLSSDPSAGLTKALRYLLFASFFVLFAQLVRSRSAVLWVLRVLTLSTTGAAAVGLAGFLTGTVSRASGPIGEANDFAYLIAAVIPLAVYLMRSDRGRRWLWGACAALLAATVLATLSRGALVGLAALALWALVTGRLRAGGVVAALVLVLGISAIALTFWGPLINERLTQKGVIATQNVASRQALWSAAVRMAADHPLLGVGTGLYGVRASDYVRDEPLGIDKPVAHNSYLEVMAEDGVPALIAFLAFIVGTWRLAAAARRGARQAGDQEGARLASAVQASLIVAIVSANFLSVQITVPLWLLGGLAVAIAGPAATAVAVARSPRGRPALAM